ncbi:MAG: hypothetical protein PUB96_08775 [Helicobacteraceae bacterium]|nr:hypothetical protein [Helicobacteraceae bacterium]
MSFNATFNLTKTEKPKNNFLMLSLNMLKDERWRGKHYLMGVYIHLLMLTNGEKQWSLSMKREASIMGISRPTFAKHFKELVELGFIEYENGNYALINDTNAEEIELQVDLLNKKELKILESFVEQAEARAETPTEILVKAEDKGEKLAECEKDACVKNFDTILEEKLVTKKEQPKTNLKSKESQTYAVINLKALMESIRAYKERGLQIEPKGLTNEEMDAWYEYLTFRKEQRRSKLTNRCLNKLVKQFEEAKRREFNIQALVDKNIAGDYKGFYLIEQVKWEEKQALREAKAKEYEANKQKGFYNQNKGYSSGFNAKKDNQLKKLLDSVE